MTPEMQMLADLIDNTFGWLLFFICVLSTVALVVIPVLFLALAIRGAWRWLKRRTWNELVATAGRKAIRRNHAHG